MLLELRSIPSGHVMLFVMISIEFCRFWGYLFPNDSIAKSPANRAHKIILTTTEMVATITKHKETNMRIKSMRSAYRNFNQIKEIYQNIFPLNRLTSWKKLTSVSLLMSLSSSFFLRNHWRQRNKLWKIINAFDCFSWY